MAKQKPKKQFYFLKGESLFVLAVCERVYQLSNSAKQGILKLSDLK